MTRIEIDNRMRKIERLIKIVCAICNNKGNPPHMNSVLGGLFEAHETLIIARRSAR